MPETDPDPATAIYEQLLALGNRVGAAYLGACEKAAAGIGEFQQTVASVTGSDWLSGAAGWQTGDFSENLMEMSRKLTLAYLDACEVAALAVAECQEEVAAASGLEAVKTFGAARADVTREVTTACMSTARQIVG
jgi:hypothetical protein